jgi:formylglycine-generating enzyme required for sulfatase activity
MTKLKPDVTADRGRSLVGRVDLVRALDAGGALLQEALADLLGYQRQPRPKRPADVVSGREDSQRVPPAPPPPPAPLQAVDLPFWLPTEFEPVLPLTAADTSTFRPAPLQIKPVQIPTGRLCSDAQILTRLRRYSAFSDANGGVDLDKLVDRLSRGALLPVLPRKRRKRWGQSIHIIVDRSRRLAPYWADQDQVCADIERVYPSGGVKVAIFDEGCGVPPTQPPRSDNGYTFPHPGTIVLVLGDLGCLARPLGLRDKLKTTWLAWGRAFQSRDNPTIALVPCDPGRCDRSLARLWKVLPWENVDLASNRPSSEPDSAKLTQDLLNRLAFAMKVEPELLRAVRRKFLAGRADAGIESLFWQDKAVVGHSHLAATLDPRVMKKLLPDFFRLDSEERRWIYNFVRKLRRDDYPGVWNSELLALEREVEAGLLDRAELEAAARWYDQWMHQLQTGDAPVDPADHQSHFFRRVHDRLPVSAGRGIAARALHAIEGLVSPNSAQRPAWSHPELMSSGSQTERPIALRQVADRLEAWAYLPGGFDDEPPGSLLALIRTCNGLIKIEPLDNFWQGGIAPKWADEWRTDEFGPWVELRVKQARQRLRWIPPGTFLMGSPGSEEGRFDDEGPQHVEAIASGFWMFDTPCTQALWEMVMGENPSHFKEPDRPVENVDWHQCQEFVKRLNGMFPDLRLKLPSEAQWEYTCRAGTQTPRYEDDLDKITWYRSNSESQTHPVKLKVPNAWGLYDTIGNVWEWCDEVWTDDYSEKAPAGAAFAERVVRGGSWDDYARSVRAACRFWFGPGDRLDVLGFRCAELTASGPVGQEKGQEAERARERGGVGAEHPGDRDQASEAGWINVDAEEMNGVSFASLAAVRVSSDVEQVVLRTTTRPTWASAIGRDRYGLWARFTIEGNMAKAPSKRTAKKTPPKVLLSPVHQRLRWIPPGRFLMGSPEDEEGRYDWEQLPHEVTIDEGFWMFDTPCTQALWEAVMGNNPSRFKAPDRPVETVTWNQCQEFVDRLNGMLPDLRLKLPSEAQWEYACRAGTTTSTYAGQLEMKGANNAPILDAIAWYVGNSGVDFDLSDGVDASSWPDKQYPFDKAGTHQVCTRRANPWGLFDILGNVWEWCQDAWVNAHTRDAGAADTPSAHRVIRGGSWGNDAKFVRAAYRYHLVPSDRGIYLGFRCAELTTGPDGSLLNRPVSRPSFWTTANGSRRPAC